MWFLIIVGHARSAALAHYDVLVEILRILCDLGENERRDSIHGVLVLF